jgi:type I restriction enzyme S subunit
MTTHHLLHHFAPITEAPAAIARLRQFVLDLAVRGKLVAQEPSDEPASEFLKRIADHKAQIAKENRLKVQTEVVLVEEEDEPYPIPASWVWVRFGSIIISRDGERIPVSKEERNHRAKIYDYYGASGVIDQIDGYLFDKPLLLIGEDGANLINRSTPIAFIARGKYWVNNHAHVLDGISEEFLRFIELYINATDLKPYVTGTAQPKMNQAKMNSIPVALPPLAEQQRIVAKVDELMTLCDELAAAQSEREARRDRLVAATLHRLAASAADPTPFPERAHFYFTHLPRLTTRPEHIHQLRQTILTLAVQGKLVPQDPHDEPASLLFNKLTKVKEHMLATRSMKSSKLLQDYSEADLPYTIPSSWAWVMLGEITDIGTGSTPSRTVHEFWQNGHIPWITSGLTSQTLITEADEFVTTSAVEQHRLKLYKPGTLLVALYGQGKTRGQVATLGIEATVNQACAAVCAINGFEDLQHYLRLLLQKIYEEVRTLSAGGTQPNLNVQKIKEILVPLPPLAEQQRIVARVDELLALCDELAANLDTVTATRRRLLEAALQEALVAASGERALHAG